MTSILDSLGKERIHFDGGLGTMLQACGLSSEEDPQEWSITHPNELTDIHKQYLDAGCDVITANTFGVTRDKYDNYYELIKAAMDCAKKAVLGRENKYVAFDVGPTGRLMAPLGDLDFEEAVSIFSDSLRHAQELGADLIIIETMNDCAETKAAVIAAKETSTLPIFVCNAYDRSGKLMTGASPAAMVAMLEGLGVDAIGLNCSFGPDVTLDIIDEFIECSSIPLIVMPNAGLPEVREGKTVYNISPEEYADYMVRIAQKGAAVLGGCCGTTPEYIKKTIAMTRDIPLEAIKEKNFTVISSYTHAVRAGGEPLLIGERINPTGKPKLKEALRTCDMNYVLGEALAQADAGAQILDVNVGLPEIDEAEMLFKVSSAVASVCDLPLQLDTGKPSALEKALRRYAGKPLINSVNGSSESMAAVFPLVKKYGGAVIALTMDENGIPSTAEGRVAIAERILSVASSYGISKKDIIVDPLCLTVSSDPQSALVTLNAVRLLSQKGFKTSLGVSNISFGLPEREKINSTFFALALENGLDFAIMNPRSQAMTDVWRSFKVLHGMDTACMEYIKYASSKTTDSVKPVALNDSLTLKDAIVKGLKNKASELSALLLKSLEPLSVINDHIIPALNDIGEQFDRHKAYLPQLLMSADAATAAFAKVKSQITTEEASKGRDFIIATVKGDIHDIGKNIVRVMLESYGFRVHDLGRDVEPEKVLDCVKETGCRLVGLSALMTTTVPAMEETIKLIKAYNQNVTVVVGGAVLNKEYADMIGADFYARDAMETVRFTQKYYSQSSEEL